MNLKERVNLSSEERNENMKERILCFIIEGKKDKIKELEREIEDANHQIDSMLSKDLSSLSLKEAEHVADDINKLDERRAIAEKKLEVHRESLKGLE